MNIENILKVWKKRIEDNKDEIRNICANVRKKLVFYS